MATLLIHDLGQHSDLSFFQEIKQTKGYIVWIRHVLENSRISLVLTSVFTVPLNISFMVLTPKYIRST